MEVEVEVRERRQWLIGFFFFYRNFVIVIKEVNTIYSNLEKYMYTTCSDVIGESKVMFSNNFCFLFSKTYFWEYKEKPNFLYFLNQKYVWLVEIKKKIVF